MRRSLRRAPTVALTALLAACGGDGDAPRTARELDTVTVARPSRPAPPPPDSGRVETDGAIAVEVRRSGPADFSVRGETSSSAQVEISVEDGHRVLFGPATVDVVGGRFRLDLAIEQTSATDVTVFVGDPAGEHQTSLRVPLTGAESVVATGEVAAAPAPAVETGGDRRTRVTAEGLESRRVRVRWPAVREGDPQLAVEGETDATPLLVDVRRAGARLAVRRVEAPGEGWRAFSALLPVPRGVREGDAVVVSLPGDSVPELVFQPIRN